MKRLSFSYFFFFGIHVTAFNSCEHLAVQLWILGSYYYYYYSSIGSATLVGFGLLNCHWVFSARRFLQSAVASSTSNPLPGGPVIRTFQLSTGSPQRLKRRKRTPAAEGGTVGEKLPKVATSMSLLGSFTCRKFMTWDRRLYFPTEGRRAEDFSAQKIRWLRLGLYPQTRVPKASTLTCRPLKLLNIG